MSNKPYVLGAILLQVIITGTACTNPAKPRNPVQLSTEIKNDSDFKWSNQSLKNILSELAATYKIQICNPKGITGINITAVIGKNRSITEMCAIVSRAESGHAYLTFKNDYIFVSETPFRIDFMPNKKDWPCD